jgi:hypothetical protein
MNTFISASVWADQVADTFPPGWRWHLQQRAYDPQGILSDEKKQRIEDRLGKNDIVFGLHQAISTLKNPKSNLFEKGVMLRYLIHMVGDIHMPLHCGSLYSPEFPSSDRAGTRYPLLLQTKKKTLHAFWDGSLRQDTKSRKLPLTEESEKDIEAFAKEIIFLFPQDGQEGLKDLNISHWADESFFILQNSVYVGISPNTVPSEEYIERNRKIAYERIALSGYRLAAILHKVLEE